MSDVNPDNKCSDLLESFNYKEDSLQYMIGMQRDLQEFIAGKKGGKAPKDVSGQESSELSIYYWGCVTAEFFEMCERLNDFDWNLERIDREDKLEIWFELIDIWHFLMNVFLYSGLDEKDFKFNLEQLYFDVNTYCLDTPGETQLTIISRWGDMSYTVGQLFNELPYKRWKKYTDDIVINRENLQKSAYYICVHFMTMAVAFGINKETFFNLYMSKNKENIARQEVGGKYYSE